MRPAIAMSRVLRLGLALVTGLVTSTCGGGRDVAGPDGTPAATAIQPSTAAAEDAFTSAGAGKSGVCHREGNGRYKLMTLPPPAIAEHLAHGDLLAATRYGDADADGYGAGASFQCPATTSTRFATVAGDCRDNDASVNPGAIDDSQNSVDNDCDGLVDEDLCPCAIPYLGQNWAQSLIQGSSGGQSFASSACHPVAPYVPGTLLQVDYQPSPDGQRKLFLRPGDGSGGCGYDVYLFDTTGAYQLIGTGSPSMSAAQIAKCASQIQATAAYGQCH